MSTAVMTLQQHRPLLQPAKKMVMLLSPPHDQPHIVQPSNGACVIVSANVSSNTASFSPSASFTALTNNNNTSKAKNANGSTTKVTRVAGGAVQKARTSVVVAGPAATTAAANAAADALRCKRRIQFTQGVGAPGAPGTVTFTGQQTASVARRNARERNRVKQVNNGFATLRSHIPPAIAAALAESSGTGSSSGSSSETKSSARQTAKEKEAAKKLSKVETLRMAVEYIRRLQELLNETTANNENANPGTPVTVKSEAISMSDSGFDADYEAALALSHYSMASTPSSTTHPITTMGGMGSMPRHPHHFVSMSPPCSDSGSAGSPTPSYVSDGSAGASSTGGYAPANTNFVTSQHPGHCRSTVVAHSPATPPDSTMYEPMSPEDEELLDVISWWQQSH